MKSTFSFILTLLGFTALLSCTTSPQSGSPGLQSEMRDAYSNVRELFGYVWAENRFMDSSSEREIRKLLKSLAKDFHQVEAKAAPQLTEPGFKINLATHQKLLDDAATRFAEGNKDYALWRLRGITESCIACHSRHKVPVDFLGDVPLSIDPSPEAKLAQAEFLFASRQFDKAESALFDLTTTFAATPHQSRFFMRSLKLWLVIKVRVKDKPLDAMYALARLRSDFQLDADSVSLIQAWEKDLKLLSQHPRKEINLRNAEELLTPITSAESFNEENAHLVTTLKASAILHQLLLGQVSDSDRRRGTYLLALAYAHMPLHLFATTRDLYVELTIQDFPGTDEAKRAFELYDQLLSRSFTGSSGLNLEPDQLEQREALRKKAFGRS